MSALFRRAPSYWRVLPMWESCCGIWGRAALQQPAASSIIATRHFGNVNVILREDLDGRGYKGEEVLVRGGYMRNFLFPNKKAVYATNENRALYQSVQKTEDVEKIRALKALKSVRRTLSRVPILFKRHVENPGAPLREVTAQNVSDFLMKSRRLEIPPENVDMEPITKLGVHDIRIQINFTEDTREMLKEELGVEEFEESSWVDVKLTVTRR